MDTAWDKSKTVLKYVNPVAWLVAEGVEKAVDSIKKASEKGLDDLKAEITKQNFQIQIQQQQARIAQELAIARRIENAAEVEIEEFYDASGSGNFGINLDSKLETASIGIGGEGRKVTKRVYHFRGWKDTISETINQED
jgi:uncharacterized lipoprotein YajG